MQRRTAQLPLPPAAQPPTAAPKDASKEGVARARESAQLAGAEFKKGRRSPPLCQHYLLLRILTGEVKKKIIRAREKRKKSKVGGGRKAPGIPGRPQAPVCRQASCAACGSAAPHFTVTSLANRARERARSLSPGRNCLSGTFAPPLLNRRLLPGTCPRKSHPLGLGGRTAGRQTGRHASNVDRTWGKK